MLKLTLCLPLPQYLHESRHLHALSRSRGEAGRFVNSNDDNAQTGFSANAIAIFAGLETDLAESYEISPMLASAVGERKIAGMEAANELYDLIQ